MAKKTAKKKTKVQWRTKKEMVVWHLINSGLAGALVFAGAFVNGGLTSQGVVAALSASLIVALTKFKEFWSSQEGTYKPAMFHFIH